MRPLPRPVTDADAPGLIALIDRCFADYPGCVLDTVVEEPALQAPHTAYTAKGGQVWVVADGPDIKASVGLMPDGSGWQLIKLYVHPLAQGQGLGRHLLAFAEDEARRRGAQGLSLWSDTRFVKAHALYEKNGYRKGGSRALHDLSATTEFFFEKAF